MDDDGDRHREPDLVRTCKKAWKNMPVVKVLRAFEMRRDIANEALANDGWCETEGKGGGGAKRVHTEPCYAALRRKFNIEEDD